MGHRNAFFLLKMLLLSQHKQDVIQTELLRWGERRKGLMDQKMFEIGSGDGLGGTGWV